MVSAILNFFPQKSTTLNKENFYHLNSFQRVMLKWNSLTPYNAGHVIHLAGIPDLLEWNKIILGTIRELNLGIPEFWQNEKFVKFTFNDNLNIETPSIKLNEHINSELNRPFLRTDFPIRFFILQEDKESYYFGAIYDHWLSDSYSMRAFFQRLFAHLSTGKSNLPKLCFNAPPICSLFKAYLGNFPRGKAFFEIIKSLIYFQSVYRIKMADPLNFHTGFNRYYLPDGLINNIATFAKNHQASINDVFLAALAKTMGEFTLQDRAKQKRKKFRIFPRNRIALGTIVDIRQPVFKTLENVFGQYLSNYSIVLKNPETQTFKTLLNKISKQTQKFKKTYKTIKNIIHWDISLFIWKFLTKPKSQARFFNKNTPICAGISNVDLTTSWIGLDMKNPNSLILDYLRISPTGLLLPIVFTLTTLQQKLSLCVSFRTTTFSDEEADYLSKRFIYYLTNITSHN